MKLDLHSAWEFRAADPALSLRENFAASEGWRAATVPGTVYQDLLAHGLIPDPHVGLNEAEVQWVAERDWCYRCRFDLSLATLGPQTDLVFEGLDTFAEVWLNGRRILASDNMFVPARVAVAAALREGSNLLEIRFESALRKGREQEAKFGRRHLWNGDASRLYVRKAQYHYGWDWGPVMLTAGPWQPVWLHSYAARIDDLESTVWLSESLDAARIDLRTAIVGAEEVAQGVIEHRLYDPTGNLIAEQRAPLTPDCEASLPLAQPELWWPAGHGAQPLYRLETIVRTGDRVLDRVARRIGLRRLRLVQEPVAGERGLSFYFEVNGKAIFTGGANWIPDDTLLNRISPARYRERVQQAVAGNMLMLRVWAGGIYESEAFYDACDELGVLVWQDFLFACGLYPAHEAFLASVEAEARAAIRRLRHRASLALWCGNNEDYAIAESIGLYGAGKDMARFDARAIYEGLLPTLCARLDPQRPYWPGSPYSPSSTVTLNSDDATVGDRHSWEVWHKEMLPYQHYQKVEARFVSEFGMQAHPSLDVLEAAIPEAERFPLSRTMTAHNKAGSAVFPDGHRRLAVYVADTLNAGPSLAESVYATQFVQAEAMRYAYQDFRRRWQQPGARAVGGALVWQFNDCWPVTSWAVIDSAGVVKPAWHTIRRALAPCALAVRATAGQAVICLMNSTTEAVAARLELAVYGLTGACYVATQHDGEAAANASTTLSLPLPHFTEPVIVAVRWVADGQTLAEDCAWPEPYRYHRFPTAEITVVRDPARGQIRLSAAVPVKGLWLAGSGLRFGDNFLDLMPGHACVVEVEGDLSQPLQVMALDQPPRVV